LRSTLSVIGATFARWSDHDGQRLGAALAFYTLLSAAPLAVLALLIGSMFVGRETAQGRIASFGSEVLGPAGAAALNSILVHARQPRQFNIAAAIAICALVFGASSAFLELRDDLNRMWDAHPKSSGLIGIILQRFFSFLLVLAAGAVLIFSMLATAAVSVIARFFNNVVPVPAWVLESANFAVSVVLLTAIFLLIFRFVPDLALPWNALWPGALASAILFTVGKAVLGLYLTRVGVGSSYGAAGSIIAVAFFVYYAAQIFLLGAEFTYLWARRKLQTKREALARR
jgi:membrane protein